MASVKISAIWLALCRTLVGIRRVGRAEGRKKGKGRSLESCYLLEKGAIRAKHQQALFMPCCATFVTSLV